MGALVAVVLTACGTPPPGPVPGVMTPPAAHVRTASQWVPADWQDLPAWESDGLHDAWNAWVRNCERPLPAWTGLCPHVRRMLLAGDAERRDWMREHLQPYRVESHQGQGQGLLTGYYEPQLVARRQPDATYRHALYQTPRGWAARQTWFSRQDADTQATARQALQGREIAYLADPVDVLILQIQGSGKLDIQEPDGRVRRVRLAFAGSNEQPYQSVARWLLDRREIRDASWASIKAWVAAQAHTAPDKVQAMFWSNPRLIFFREEALAEDASVGPRGALGVPLTAGRSIAVDRHSIPYGTPVWLVSEGPAVSLHRLVFAQDTGSAIVGAVRADYFVGGGDEAGQLAGKLKQNLQMWVFWPKGQQP
jgi:membrane-bound lytic murein transglycosylase A